MPALIAKVVDSVLPAPDQAGSERGRPVSNLVPAPDPTDSKKSRPAGKKLPRFTAPPASAPKREGDVAKWPADKRVVAGEEAAERKPSLADTARAIKKAKASRSSRSVEVEPVIPGKDKTKNARKVLRSDLPNTPGCELSEQEGMTS